MHKRLVQCASGQGLQVLMLVTDAHGGFGGIAQYNRDIIDAMCGLECVSEVVVLPRIRPETGFTHPSKSSYDVASAAGKKGFLIRCAAHATKKYDLVYCAHINLLPVAAALARARRLPLMLAIYGIDAWQRPTGLAGGRGLGAVSLVASISQITLDRFRAWSSFAADKCAVLPNAIHATDFAVGPKKSALAYKLGVAERPVILTFGRMVAYERYKGFDEVIEAMPRLIKRVPGLVYVAAGDGSDRRRLEEKAKALGVADHVRFTGRVSEAEKGDLYRLSDAYVMPSSGEGFGFVILEALACGIPVVGSTVDGTREALRNGELGLLVDPKNSNSLEEAILKAMSQPKAIPAGLDYFSFANFKSRLANTLDQAVALPT